MNACVAVSDATPARYHPDTADVWKVEGRGAFADRSLASTFTREDALPAWFLMLRIGCVAGSGRSAPSPLLDGG